MPKESRLPRCGSRRLSIVSRWIAKPTVVSRFSPSTSKMSTGARLLMVSISMFSAPTCTEPDQTSPKRRPNPSDPPKRCSSKSSKSRVRKKAELLTE